MQQRIHMCLLEGGIDPARLDDPYLPDALVTFEAENLDELKLVYRASGLVGGLGAELGLPEWIEEIEKRNGSAFSFDWRSQLNDKLGKGQR